MHAKKSARILSEGSTGFSQGAPTWVSTQTPSRAVTATATQTHKASQATLTSNTLCMVVYYG